MKCKNLERRESNRLVIYQMRDDEPFDRIDDMGTIYFRVVDRRERGGTPFVEILKRTRNVLDGRKDRTDYVAIHLTDAEIRFLASAFVEMSEKTPE